MTLPERRISTAGPIFWLACLFFACALRPAAAQQANLSVYQELALDCLADAPDSVRAFRLVAPASMPYLRTALVGQWQEEGRTVFLPDTTQRAATLPELTFMVETAAVDYAADGRDRLQRTLNLALRYTLATPDGLILRESRCSDSFSDVILRERREAVEAAAFPETQGKPPEAGWLRRYVEPAVLTAATALGVYLFFTLRSKTASSSP